MIEIVLGLLGLTGYFAELGNIRDGNNQLLRAVFKIETENAGVFRRRLIGVRVGQTGVAITGPHIIDSPEIRRDSRAAIRTESVEWIRQRSFLAGLNIKNVAHKSVALPVVPENVGFRPRPPLQHTALLPAPRPACTKLAPAVALLQVHHSDLDNIVSLGAAVLETHLHPQHVATSGIELQLVVVAEPMEARTGCDRPNSR